MREIKFRAWDTINKRWIDISSIQFSGDNSIVGVWELCEKENILYGLHQVDLVQYTGLKDKNGKEIYEGDILEFIYYHQQANGNQSEGKYLVCFGQYDNNDEYEDNLHGNGWYLESSKKIMGIEDSYYDNFVIGNIYENPSLLEDK